MIKDNLWKALKQCMFYSNIETTIDDDTSLLHTIGLDSIQLLEFIVNIEKVMEFKIDFELLSIDDFDSINSLTKALNNQEK
jgi:phosphopantetheine attachment domain protein